VVEVKRASERALVLRVVVGKKVVNLVSMYAPQVGRRMEEKEEFYASMCVVLAGIDPGEELFIGRDLNGHTGRRADEFEEVHGGEGYGDRNTEGEMLLEFAVAMGLAVVNTWFRKKDNKKVTYESGGCKSAIDYVLMRQCDRKRVKDVRVIQNEPCIPQHKLVICEVNIMECVKRKKVVFVSRCKVWRLKNADKKKCFQEKVADKAVVRAVGNVEREWKDLKDCLLEAAEEVCGRTKGPSNKKQTSWWNDELDGVVAEKRRLFGIWKTSKNESDKDAYSQAKNLAKKVINKAQEAERKELVEMLDSAEGK